MARAITKEFGSVNTRVNVMHIVDGAPKVETLEFEGKKSARALQAAIRAKLKTQNFMLQGEPEYTGGANARYTMDAVTFYSLSEECEMGESYGHDTITATFRVTHATYFDASGEHVFVMLGTTTENKLRKAIVDATQDNNILVLPNPEVYETRQYMPKEVFIAHATKVEN